MTEGKKSIEHHGFESALTRKAVRGYRQSDLRSSKRIDLALIEVLMRDKNIAKGKVKKEVLGEALGKSEDQFHHPEP